MAEQIGMGPPPGDSFCVVVIAASAGGLAALSEVLAALPADFPAAVVAVLHRGARAESLLEGILGRRTALTVKRAEENDRLQTGTVYVAPAGVHLLLGEDGRLT